MKITGNEPAMPQSDIGHTIVKEGNVNSKKSTGLTIRQQFAMAAMHGILANLPKMELGDAVIKVSAQAVIFADGLINELNKSEK